MFGRRWISVDAIFTLGFLMLFIWAILQARQWPFRTALFPVLTSVFAVLPILLKLVLDFRGRRPLAAVPKALAMEDDEADELELEEIFESAPRAVWLDALLWLGIFFAMLWAFGVYLTVPLFALAYLRLVSRESVPVAVGYAVVSWIFIYGLFDQLLHVPLPTSGILDMLGRRDAW